MGVFLCSIFTAASQVQAGDVLFLRGGTYNVNTFLPFQNDGTSSNNITVESYPGETAILDGSSLSNDGREYIRLFGDYYKFRLFEVQNFPGPGIYVEGNNNIIDGIKTHNNKLSGIQIYASSSVPTGSMGSYNTLQNITSTDNSDVGLSGGNYNDGNNADGISISGGEGNTVLNFFVSKNSND